MKALFLVGFMGAGKSTLGKELAQRLSWDFYDLDEEIERIHHHSIPELFSELGETKFRVLEKEVLNGFETKTASFVLASGGGTPCFFDNMEWMKKQGEVLFIDTEPRELLRRLKGKESGRPVLKSLKPERFEEEMLILLGKRRPFYLQAPWILGKNVRNIDEVIHMLNS
ncbi:MAG TPA: shikimate kinase [Bacteroidetes bacterium]|nr:shikimate kinase [Bacteroidota bacterium]